MLGFLLELAARTMVAPSLLEFVVHQWSTVPPVERADLADKVVAVVGANTGIGFEAAKHFARMNPAKLILGCRNENKGVDAVSRIESTTGFKSCRSSTIDLASFSSVVRFAEGLQREHGRLDVLVMNAGIAAFAYEETVDGWESSLQVNHLGTALLSFLLLPLLVETGKKFGCTPRLVIVSSLAHYWAFLPGDVARSTRPVARLSSQDYRNAAAMHHRYNQTKLLNVMFARALQDRLRPAFPLTVNAVCPGYCYSGLRRSITSLVMNVILTLWEFFLAWSAEKGSRALVHAAVGGREDEGRMKGAYVRTNQVVEPSDFVMSAEGKTMQDHVWTETLEVLSLKVPRLKSILTDYLV